MWRNSRRLAPSWKWWLAPWLQLQLSSVQQGLLLGFFLSSSVQRWYNCTNGFLELFDAVRGLHMQLNAMGVPKDRRASNQAFWNSCRLFSIDLLLPSHRLFCESWPGCSFAFATAWCQPTAWTTT